MIIQRKRVAKRLASGLLAGALALGGLAISGGPASANTPSSPSTSRLSGADRYDTAVAVARAQLNTTSAGAISATNPDSLIIASGENYADALAGSVLTTATRPMLLVRKDSIPESVSDFIADYKTSFASGSKRVYVLGGESAISAEVFDALKAAITTAGSTTPPIMTRLAGADRYETAKLIGAVTGITTASDSILIVDGTNFPDALSAGMLAAIKGWPIVLSSGSGLTDSAKEQISSYLSLAGSSKSFVIIGGPAAVPTSVEDYLIATKSVAPANVRRIAGADRYQTNFLVNAEYVLTGGISGANLALVSGEAPWDALSAAGFALKTNTHIVLTPTAGGNINVATLAATLAAYNDAGYATNQRLWVIGGRSAVTDAAKTGYIAGSNTDLTSTLTCPTAGSNANSLTLTLSGQADGDGGESGALTSISAIANVMKKNSISLAGSVSATSDKAALVPGTKRQAFSVRLTAPLAANDVITFSGFVEGVAPGTNSAYTATRSIGASSCTVAADATGPSITMKAVAGPGGTKSAQAGFIYLKSDEAVTVGAQTSLGTQGATTTAPLKVGSTTITETATVIALDASAVDGYATEFLIGLANPTTGVNALPIFASQVVTLAKSAIVNRAGLSPSLDVTATSVTDSAVPTFTVAGVRSTAKASAGNAVYKSTSLSVSANIGGDYDGAKGSGYGLSIVNQRGMQAPTVAFDHTAKTIVVTADTGYHTPADVDMARRNAGIGGWKFSLADGYAATSKLNATVAPAVCASGRCGKDVVEVLIVSSEVATVLKAGLSISVGGFAGSPYITANSVNFDNTGLVADKEYKLGSNLDGNSANYAQTAFVVNFDTQYEGAGTISFSSASLAAAGAADLFGNYSGIAPVTFTVS